MVPSPSRRTPALPPAALLLALTLVLPACGGGDEGGGEASPSTRDAPAARVPETELPLPGMADTSAADTTGAAAPTDSVPPPAAAAPARGAPEPEPAPEPAPAPARSPAAQAAPSAAAGAYSLQLGSFRNPDHADRLVERLRADGRPAVVETAVVDGLTYHRVLLHGMADRDEARRVGEDLRATYGIDYLIRRRP